MLRLAVPDCFAPRARSQRAQSLKEDIAYGHKIRWTLASLQRLLVEAGFPRRSIVPLEYHSEEGFMYRRRFDPRDGFVKRSFPFDRRGAVSLIVDAVKACHTTCKVATRKFELQSRYAPAALPTAVRELENSVAGNVQVAKQVLELDPVSPRALRTMAKEHNEPAWQHMADLVEAAATERIH